jgi:hypothetical protein
LCLAVRSTLADGARRDQDGGVPKSHDKSVASTEPNGSAGSPRSGQPTKTRKGPEVVAPSSRVNVAFPFSQIKLQEPSQELADLAALMFELVVAMEQWVPDDQLEDLRTRALALRERLR